MDCCLLGSSVLGDSPGKNTGVGCPALLQRIFPDQGSNQYPLLWQADSYPLSTREVLQLSDLYKLNEYKMAFHFGFDLYVFHQ